MGPDNAAADDEYSMLLYVVLLPHFQTPSEVIGRLFVGTCSSAEHTTLTLL